MRLEYEVRMAIKGDKEAFSTLIKSHEELMYKMSKTILKSDSDCADAIQETILRAYKGIKNLKEAKYFKTWLVKILINECNKVSIQNGKVILFEDVRVDTDGYYMEDSTDIYEIIDGLEKDLKQIVILYYIEDLPVKEISKIVDIKEGTVKSRLSRARKKLEEILSEDIKRSESNEGKYIG